MKTRTKVILGTGGVALFAVAAVLGSNGSRTTGIDARTEEVQRRNLVETVTASGNVRARRKVDISSDISARVTEMLVEEGADVVEGQVLLRLDPTRFQASLSRSQAALLQARAQVAQARANYLQAERDAQRLGELRARDSLLVSRQDLENAQTQEEVQRSLVESAEYGVSQSEAAVEEAQDNLAKTIIRAPMAGRVTRLNVEQGETVIVGTMNNPGSLVLTVSDLSVMEVVLEVDETDVPEIQLGDSAAVDLDAFPDRKFAGVVTEIGNSAIRSPSASAGTGQTPTIDFEVVVTLQDGEVELRPDLSATADLVTATRDDALSIPIIALTVRELSPDSAVSAGAVAAGARGEATGESSGQAAGQESGEQANGRGSAAPIEVEGAYVVRDGVATFVPVDVGIAGQEYFEVLCGLSEGDTVVSGPYQIVRTLSDGSRIRPSDPDEGDGKGGGEDSNSSN